ncbi:MAG: carboxypeptidase regulatory-like domain-containing protein [Deltaproteobacteria bacterium]|nr:carboxypeptidase regulatory-like domain-containing protein [Deltaproteobacteria bacterium]
MRGVRSLSLFLTASCAAAAPAPLSNRVAEPPAATVTRAGVGKLRFEVSMKPAPRAAPTGELHGLATDDAGDPVAGCTVVASSPVLTREEIALSDEHGRWTIAALPPGIYTTNYYWDDQTYSNRNIPVRSSQITFERLVDWPTIGRAPIPIH